jgi:membrane-bound lytic murein transglycosylase D
VVPVVPTSPAGAAVALGATRPGRAAAPADATANRWTARTFEHTPGVTWDLDVLPVRGARAGAALRGRVLGGARDRFGAWLSRGTRYEPMVRARLRAGGLPEDLYYLALVESGYDVHAFSRVGAAGMWQFMPETARELGMRLDWWVDERRDPVRATDAAVKMLRWLRGQFGSLFVAAAAYNGGPGRVSRGVALVAASEVATAVGPAADSAAAAVVAALDAARGGGDHPRGARGGHVGARGRPDGGRGRGALLRPRRGGRDRRRDAQLRAAAHRRGARRQGGARYGISVRPRGAARLRRGARPGLTPLAAGRRGHGEHARRTARPQPAPAARRHAAGRVAYAVRVPEGAGRDAAAALADLPRRRGALPPAGDEKREPFARSPTRRRVPRRCSARTTRGSRR